MINNGHGMGQGILQDIIHCILCLKGMMRRTEKPSNRRASHSSETGNHNTSNMLHTQTLRKLHSEHGVMVQITSDSFVITFSYSETCSTYITHLENKKNLHQECKPQATKPSYYSPFNFPLQFLCPTILPYIHINFIYIYMSHSY